MNYFKILGTNIHTHATPTKFIGNTCKKIYEEMHGIAYWGFPAFFSLIFMLMMFFHFNILFLSLVNHKNCQWLCSIMSEITVVLFDCQGLFFLKNLYWFPWPYSVEWLFDLCVSWDRTILVTSVNEYHIIYYINIYIQFANASFRVF